MKTLEMSIEMASELNHFKLVIEKENLWPS